MKKVLKIGIALLATSSLIFAESDVVAKQNFIQKKLDSIMVKEGLAIGGNFRSELIKSKIDGNAANKLRKQSEDVTYTQVDFDFKARPNTSTTAHAIMRMHANWPVFFGSLNNPISVRWISLDGKIGNYAVYHVGDFKTKWSPLTIWNYSKEMINEPYIFQEQRAQQMAEVFSAPGDNYRAFQGVNLKVATKVSVFDYLGLDLVGARLRASFIQKANPITTGANLYTTSFESAEYDRMAYGGKADFQLFNTNIAAMLVNTADAELSTKYHVTPPLATQNIAFSLKSDIAKFLNNDNLKINVNGEYGMSQFSNDTGFVDPNYTKDLKLTDGTALSAGFDFGMDLGNVNFLISGGMRNNSKDFRADLSQSPSYMPREILNIDNDTLNSGYEHFNMFDSRYHGVWKSLTKDYTERGIEYTSYPSTKLAYTNVIISGEETGVLGSYIKSSNARFDLIAPDAFGPATPNLNLINASLNVGALNNAVVVNGSFASGKENEEIKFVETTMNVTFDSTAMVPDTSYINADVNIPVGSYSNIGAGLVLNLDKFLSYPRPIKLSGGYEMISATRDGMGIDSLDERYEIKMDLKSSLLNTGLYFGVVKKLAVLAGYQMYTVKDDTYSLDYAETNLLAGLEYKVNNGAYLLFEYGMFNYKDNKNENNNFNTPIFNTKISVNF